MKITKPLLILSILTGLLAILQAGAGLFVQTAGGPFPFTTLRGETVDINGQGIYFYDTYFKAPILRGTDFVTLVVAVPLLAVVLWLAWRGSLRAGLALNGVLSYLLYNSASIALGAAYNNLFLLYIAYFSASVFAFILAFRAVDVEAVAERVGSGAPRRGIAWLMFFSGAALLVAWLGDILGPLFSGGLPSIASYTTEVTYAFDLGIITPLAFLTGALILRRAPLGYQLSVLMLVTLGIVGVMVAMQTVFQSLAGIELPIGAFIGKAGSFMVLAVIAVVLLVRFFKSVKDR